MAQPEVSISALPLNSEPDTTTAARPPREPHVAALDGLRAVAVAAVFFVHYGGGASSSSHAVRFIGQLTGFGRYGVTLFFLLSGFLITGILFDSRDDAHWFRSFYIRRSLRVVPLYYSALLIYAAVALALGVFRQSWNTVWIFALYLQNVAPFKFLADHITVPLSASHFWSLAVEEHFYLIWPFLLIRARTRHGVIRICLAACLFSLLYQAAVLFFFPAITAYDGPLFLNTGALSLGGLLAMLYRGRWHRWVPAFPWIAAGAFMSAAALALHRGQVGFQGRWQQLLGNLALTVFLAAMLAITLQPGWLQRALSVGWVRWLGKISFGIYVYHVFLASLFDTIAEHLAGPGHRMRFLALRALVAAVLSVLTAWLSYEWLERPWLRLKDRFAPRTPSTARKLEAVYEQRSPADLDRAAV